MPTFGLIAEGVTDHVVLENILIGYFNDPDLVVRQLQPLRDATNELKGFGNWYNVFEYCKSTVFKDAFIQIDYFVIQIDTDCAHEKNYDVPPIHGESTAQFIERIIDKFVRLILDSFGNEFYESHKDKILFAVSVDEIECWLLPLYYTDKTRTAVNNCLHKLNQSLGKLKKETINPSRKDAKIYEKLSRDYCKTKILKASYPHNPSFNYFVERYLVPIDVEMTN
ncbi:hypothetical protein [Runella sp.]|uniref:hypothetical protein n=1 Tax=Runella sp. TaxID=1960881 RepID=UPI003D152404